MDWESYEADARDAYERAATTEDLSEVNRQYTGRRSPLRQALRQVRDREAGRVLNEVKQRLEQAVHDAATRIEQASLEQALSADGFDVTLPGEELPLGTLHPTTQVRRIVEDTFLGLGYEIREDREVETVEYNFDKLAFAPTHPTRSPHQTLFLDERTLMRTETSPSQIHRLEEREPPVYMVSIGRVYRRDTIDATHYPIFHQFEGLAVDRGITLADLKGTLLYVMRALFGEERRVRFRTHFFPFTEPSMEPDVSCPICGGAGCRTCEFSGWIELGGSGMVDPAVFENVGLDPEEWTGFAFGCGLERAAQLRHGIDEIRPLWSPDLRVLRQF